MWTSSTCILDDMALVRVLTHGTACGIYRAACYGTGMVLMWTPSDVALILLDMWH
jgi:hypothetical protein